MAKLDKNYGPSLLQKDPAREAILEKMRDKLARNLPAAQVKEIQRNDLRKHSTANWTIRIVLAIMVMAASGLFFGEKEKVLSHLGYQAVPSLPKPAASLSDDEQALYWTYALYDIQKFRSHFKTEGFFAIDQKGAKQNLQNLLPKISMSTLGTISAYAPVAFSAMKDGGVSP